MKLGYNTNGLACHRWRDALPWLAELGYESVAITIDHHCLDPFAKNFVRELADMQQLLDELAFINVIETGARFLLNPRAKHEPTLMSATPEARAGRVAFLKTCVDIAAELNSDAVSFWSGILREEIPDDIAMQRLVNGCQEVAEYANTKGVRLAFEPEPGMFLETQAQFRELHQRVNADCFGLTIDIGHLQCVEPEPLNQYLLEFPDLLWNIHIEDMCKGIHEHLRFGEGEIDFPPLITALKTIDYRGGLNVELSRHSHMAPEVVRESLKFLKGIV